MGPMAMGLWRQIHVCIHLRSDTDMNILLSVEYSWKWVIELIVQSSANDYSSKFPELYDENLEGQAIGSLWVSTGYYPEKHV